MTELIQKFNEFFDGKASVSVVDDCVHVTIGDQTLLIKLPSVVGGQCNPVDVTD